MQILGNLSTRSDQDKSINKFKDSSERCKETISFLQRKIQESKTLSENLNEKICFAKKVLGAHNKKYRERIDQAQNELIRELDLKTRILTARRTYMIQRVSFIFNESSVLSGYSGLLSKSYTHDEEISTALGYLNLLIQIVYDINGVYLPYPSYFSGSRSLIHRDGMNLPLYNTSKNIDTKVLQAIDITFSNIQQILNSYKNINNQETDILRFLNIRLA